uniref:Uncharacterized protein n=1 Tax=Panagrolaimus sp. ES5 TaxID=591445 RepID=A0AC34GZ66_9BILA
YYILEAGRQTVIVLGHSDNNLLKIAFVQRLVNDTDVEKTFDECGAASFLTFHSDKSGTLDKQLNHHLVQATFLNSQTCTVTITTKGTDEMSLEELQTLQEMIYYVNSGLIVIEIGNKATQTTVILEHSTFCWGITSLHIDAPNTVLLCNDVKISETPLLNGAKIKTLFENDNDQIISPSAATTITWPTLFPSVMAASDSSATNNEKKIRTSKKTAQKSTREIYYKKGRKIAINWDDIDQEPEKIDIEHLRKKAKRVACKYRKSCYETGILPNLKAEKTVFSTDQSIDEGHPDIDEIDEDDTLALKVLCKYRTSCYAEIGMDMSDSNHKKSTGVLITKKSAFLEPESRPRKKESVREIARKAVKEVEMKDRENPKAKISVIEKHLTETEEKLEMKNRCKYRKSCYQSGKLPDVDGYHPLPWLSIEPIIDYASVYLNKGEKDEDEKSFKEKNERQRKLYCKYRKSCYDTGIAPEIDQTQKFHFEEVVERPPAQIPVEVRCKYRKSCYETGIVPDFTKPVKQVKIKSKPIPVTVEDLKVQCKYRKSCYREKAWEVPKNDEKDDDEKEEEFSNKRIFVEEVLDDKELPKSIEETVEEVVEDVPKKAKKLKEHLPTIISVEETESAPHKKKSKSKQSHEENKDEEEEKVSKKSKKIKSKEHDEPTPSVKKFKKQKSAELEEVARKYENIVEETIPEHISAFDLKDEEKNNNADITAVDEPVLDEPSKKDLKPKKPKKKVSKNDPAKFDEKDELESRNKKFQGEGHINLKQKLQCKYRISCYESHVSPHIRDDPLVWHYKKNYLSISAAPPTPNDPISEERWNQLNDLQRKVECKYRRSCYETRKLPPILTATDGIFHVKHVFADHLKHEDNIDKEEFQKRSESQRKLICKYRKSCYDSGKLPKLEDSIFYYPTHKQASETVPVTQNLAHKRELERKVECKYRKSCYKSGKLPPLSPASVETVIESIHDNPKETLQQRCKYRKSCYAAAAELKKAKHEHRSKPGIIDEETLVVKNVKTSHIREKSSEKEEADTSSEEKRSKKSDAKPAKKQKQKASASKKQKEKDDDDDSKEDEYKEISREEKPKVNATELAKNLTTRLKVACKYRQSCYLTAVNDRLPPEQVMRMRGIKCSRYRLSCREQLGLPPIIRAPIGPSGRKLCRKKKQPENSLKM